jgi:hypothetical protein
MVLRIALRVLAIAFGTLFVGLLGAEAGILNSDTVEAAISVGIVTRSALAIVVLLALTRGYRIRDRRAADHAGRPHQQVLIAAGIAYAVNLLSWGGTTLFSQYWMTAGLGTILLDFIVWMAVAIAGVRLGERARVQAAAAPVPYA